MYLYLIVPFIFLLINKLISVIIKKYTFEKFFIYVLVYFILVNFFNLIYLQNVDFFTFQTLFSVAVLFLYAGLYRSVSIKIMIHLYLKNKYTNVNNFYKTHFKTRSFDKRIKILVDNGFLVKIGSNFYLSLRGKKCLNAFKIVQSTYKIKSSG